MLKKYLLRKITAITLLMTLAITIICPFLFASQAIAANPPEISRVSPFTNNETIQIFGENLKDCEVYAWQPPTGNNTSKASVASSAQQLPAISALAAEPPKGSKKLTVVSSTYQAAFADASTVSGVSVIWVKNNGVYSKPWLANLPEIWSQSVTEAIAGERVQLYGQNLYDRNLSGKQIPTVYLKNTETNQIYKATWGLANDQEMPNQNEHKFEFILPPDTPAGQYDLWVHNGTGDVYGWSNKASIKILDKYDLIGYQLMEWNRTGVQTGNQEIDEKDIYRRTIDAPKDGDLIDSTKTIQTVIDQVYRHGGGVVQLAPGSFGITHTLELKPGVILRGSGKDATTITVAYGQKMDEYWPSIIPASRAAGAKGWAADYEPYLKGNGTPMIWVQKTAGMEDLQLIGGNGVGSLILVATADGTTAEKVFFNHIKADYNGQSALLANGSWTAQYQGIIVLSQTKQFTIWQSDIVAPNALNMLPSKHEYVRLIGNTFEVSPAQGSINTFVGSSYNSMFVENNFINGKRSFMSQMGYSGNWIFQNRSTGVGRGINGQEEFMSEYGSMSWYGQAAAIDSDSITVPAVTDAFPIKYGSGGNIKDNFNDMQLFIYVAEGRGLGQYRRVIAFEGGEFKLDEPWSVTPDTSTKFALLTASVHNMWVNNTTSEGDGISQFVYGAGIDNIIAGHEMLDNGGISMWALEFQTNADGTLKQGGVLAFNQVKNNVERYSGTNNSGIILWSQSGSNPYYKGKPYNIVGNLVRGNIITGSAEAAVLRNQTGATWRYWVNPAVQLSFDPTKTSGIQINGGLNIVEQNFIIGMPVGIRIRGDGEYNIIKSNRIDYSSTVTVLDETGKSYIIPLK